MTDIVETDTVDHGLSVGQPVLYWTATHGGLNRAEAVLARMERAQPHAAIVAFVHKNGTINITRFNHDGMAIPETDVPVMHGDAVLPSHGGWAVLPDGDWQPTVPEKGVEAQETDEERAARMGGSNAPQDPNANKPAIIRSGDVAPAGVKSTSATEGQIGG